jgi:hypothetical protein
LGHWNREVWRLLEPVEQLAAVVLCALLILWTVHRVLVVVVVFLSFIFTFFLAIKKPPVWEVENNLYFGFSE